MNKKDPERGYLVVSAIFALLMITVIVALLMTWHVAQVNYELASINKALAEQGIYTTLVYSVDMTPFNWAITAESGAFAIAASAQARKKSINNIYQYAEEWIDKWMADPEIRPYIVQVIQSFMMSNSNNN